MDKDENGLDVGLLGPDLSLRLSFVPVNGRAPHGTDHRRRYSWHVLVCKVQLSKITIVNTVSQLFRVHSAKLSQGPKLLKGHRTGKVLAEHTLSSRKVFDFIQE